MITRLCKGVGGFGWLQAVEVVGGALGMGGGPKDCLSVAFEDGEPMPQVGGPQLPRGAAGRAGALPQGDSGNICAAPLVWEVKTETYPAFTCPINGKPMIVMR